MSRKITIPLFLVLFIALVMILPTAAGAVTSSRTMPASVNVNTPITVSIAVSDYGSAGTVIETIPDGFIYIDSTIDTSQVAASVNTVTFTLFGETIFDYTIIASSNAGTYAFDGIIKDFDKNEFTIGGDTSIILVEETVEPVNDPTPDEQTTTPNVPTTQLDSEPVHPETIDEIPDEPDESETSVDDVNDESSKSVKTTPSTESTEEIPASEATPFITTFGMIVIGVIATLVHKMKH